MNKQEGINLQMNEQTRMKEINYNPMNTQEWMRTREQKQRLNESNNKNEEMNLRTNEQARMNECTN